MNNSYYRGVTILEPDTMDPLERKFPYVSENALNFMKVILEKLKKELLRD